MLRSLLCAAVAALVLASAASAHAAGGPVLVLDAQGLSARYLGGDTSTVVLRDVTQHLTSFTRGQRSPRISVTVGELTRAWKALGFAANPPLATIDPKGDRRQATLVRLSAPRLRGDDLVLTATADKGSGGGLAGRLADRADDLPGSADATTVTINAVDADPDALADIDDPLVPNRDGEWVQFHTYISTYGDDGRCGSSKWGDSGVCDGKFTDSGSTAPFNARNAGFAFSEWKGTAEVRFYAGGRADGTGTSGALRGHVPNAGSDQFYVDSGWLFSQNFQVKTGTDAAKVGQQGGPLAIDVEYHHPLFGNSGYTFDIRGWLWCMVGDAACHP
jgi:hypothetical protein